MTTYMPIGWRCSTTVLCEKLCDLPSFPFRGMYSKFSGIIDCLDSEFKNYFPNPDNFILLNEDPQIEKHKRLWTFHANLKNSHGNPQRIAFNNEFFCWFYFDLRNDKIIKKMLKRIERMYDYLSTTNDRVIFIRSILDNNEVEMFDMFAHALTALFPNLDWHLVYLHDQHDNTNTAEPHIIHKYQYSFINASTHPIAPDIAFRIIKQLNKFKNLEIQSQEIKIHKSTLNQKKYFLC